MSLILCPECKREISDKSTVCINCGYPLNQSKEYINNIEENDKLICPDFPNDLNVGKPVIFFATKIPTQYKDDVTIMVLSYNNGLRIVQNGNDFLSIHKSQIIGLEEITQQDILAQDKSIIGRAIVGGILFAGVGAVIGGLSALNNQKLVNNYCLIINYWDITTKKPVSFILNTRDSNSRFISKFKEKVLKTN